MIDERSDNILLKEEQIDDAALYVIGWRNWPPESLDGVKNEIRSLLRNSAVARGIAGAAMMRRGKVTKRPPLDLSEA